jgi:hypothetical protein
MRVCVLVDDDATDLCPNSSPFVTRFGAWGWFWSDLGGARALPRQWRPLVGRRRRRGKKLETLVV